MAPFRGGRYDGSDGPVRLELRLEASSMGRASGDLFETGPGGSASHRASFATEPFDPAGTGADGSLAVPVTAWPADRYAGGRLRLRPVDAGTLDVRVTLHHAGGGAPTVWSGVASRADDALRRLRLHLYRLEGTTTPDAPSLPAVHAPAGDGDPPPTVTLDGVLRDAGLDADPTAPASFGPAGAGADERWSDAELLAALEDLVAGPDPDPAGPWPLHLLVVDRGDRPFATGATLHSDGVPGGRASVLFHDTIRQIPQVAGRPEAFAREYLFTTVHELGHQLGLPHAWEPFGGVGPPERSDGALTFMNYPHLFPQGYRRFYRSFPFRFREEELAHLRHAPWDRIAPGAGTPDGDGPAIDLLERPPDGFSEGSPDGLSEGSPDGRSAEAVRSDPRAHPGLALELRTAGAPRFAFTEPVHVEAKLENVGRRRVRVPGDLLAPGGGLRLYVERSGSREPARSVAPIVEPQERRPMRVLGVRGRGSGEPTYALYADLDLGFGRGGFTFGEPGAYRVHAVAELPDGRIVRAAPLRVTIAPPSRAEEPPLPDLLVPEVGRALLLGGDAAGRAMDRLRDVAERGAPARLAPWAALRVGEAEARGFKRPRATAAPGASPGASPGAGPGAGGRTGAVAGTPADPERAAEWLRRAETLAAEAGPLPNIVRSGLLRTRAACHARAGREERAERDLRALERFIATTVDTNARLRRTLLREVRRAKAGPEESTPDESTGARRDPKTRGMDP